MASATREERPVCILRGSEEETKREAECWHTTPTGEKDQVLDVIYQRAVSQNVLGVFVST